MPKRFDGGHQINHPAHQTPPLDCSLVATILMPTWLTGSSAHVELSPLNRTPTTGCDWPTPLSQPSSCRSSITKSLYSLLFVHSHNTNQDPGAPQARTPIDVYPQWHSLFPAQRSSQSMLYTRTVAQGHALRPAIKSRHPIPTICNRPSVR